jgi:hypothetical protein
VIKFCENKCVLYGRQACLNGIKIRRRAQKLPKIEGENNVCCIFMLKVSFIMNLCQKNRLQTVQCDCD